MALTNAFMKDFGFEVEEIRLKGDRLDPQVQLNKVVSDLVLKNDSRHRKNLLIFYYSGHGLVTTDRPQELLLARFASFVLEGGLR